MTPMRAAMLDYVLDLEWEMFSAVRSSRPANCQRSPATFRKVRGSLFATWTDSMLVSYGRDLAEAHNQGRNLLTEKYARMDGRIEPLSRNPLIEIIVDVEADWQRELRARYPVLYRRCCRQTDLSEDGSDFAVYLHCELETYGETTLDFYFDNIKAAQASGRNLAMEALGHLVRAAGYDGPDHAERVLSGERGVG